MNQQHITLFGRATRDAEILTSKAGKQYLKFGLAVNKYNPTVEESEVTFYDVISFRQNDLAKLEAIHKGDPVFTTGRPEYSGYMSKEGESKVGITCISNHISSYPQLADIPDYGVNDPESQEDI